MAADYIPNGDKPGKSVMTNAVKEERSRFDELTKGKRHENPYGIQNELATVMMDKVGIFRNKQDMQIACDKIKELKERYKKIRPISDRRNSAIEIENHLGKAKRQVAETGRACCIKANIGHTKS